MLADLLLMQLTKIAIAIAAAFGAIAWLYPSFPRFLRTKAKQCSRKLKSITKIVLTCCIVVGAIVWFSLSVRSDWQKLKAEHKSETEDLKRSAEVLSDQLFQFSKEWQTNNNTGERAGESYHDKYRNEFRERFKEVVVELGKRGLRSPSMESGRDRPDADVILTNSKELRRLASELK